MKKLLIWIIVAWLLLPTFGPSDLLILPIINFLGMPLYLVLCGVVLWVVWHKLHGRNLKQKMRDLTKNMRSIGK